MLHFSRPNLKFRIKRERLFSFTEDTNSAIYHLRYREGKLPCHLLLFIVCFVFLYIKWNHQDCHPSCLFCPCHCQIISLGKHTMFYESIPNITCFAHYHELYLILNCRDRGKWHKLQMWQFYRFVMILPSWLQYPYLLISTIKVCNHFFCLYFCFK